MKKTLIISLCLIIAISLSLFIVVHANTIGTQPITNEASPTLIIPTPEVVQSSTNDIDIQNLNNNKSFKVHQMKFKSNTDNVKISKETAIENAKKTLSSSRVLNKVPKKIIAVLAKHTNEQLPPLPGSGIILKDYPVWVVTLSDVTVQMNTAVVHGNVAKDDIKSDGKVTADIHVFIDANTGNELYNFEEGK